MTALPNFRRYSDAKLMLAYTKEASTVMKSNKPSRPSQNPDRQDLLVCLDILHFMRCFAVCCTSEFHQLYREFISRMCQCIFHWSKEDLDLLKKAKRRKTRGTVEATELLHSLLVTFSGPQGCDTLGVPL